MEVVGLAGLGYVGVLQEVIASRPEASEIFGAYGEALTRRWFDQESGRYERPDSGQGVAAGRRFHGYR